MLNELLNQTRLLASQRRVFIQPWFALQVEIKSCQPAGNRSCKERSNILLCWKPTHLPQFSADQDKVQSPNWRVDPITDMFGLRSIAIWVSMCVKRIFISHFELKSFRLQQCHALHTHTQKDDCHPSVYMSWWNTDTWACGWLDVSSYSSILKPCNINVD